VAQGVSPLQLLFVIEADCNTCGACPRSHRLDSRNPEA
jgi:hypothetical protein